MAEKSTWDQANIRQKLGLVWRNGKKISQIIKDYLYLTFFLLIIFMRRVVERNRVARSSWYSRGPFCTHRLLKNQIKSDIEKWMLGVLDARQAKNAAILGLE